MKNILAKKTKGFSLIEIIVYVAVFIILVTSLVSFVGSLNSARLKNKTDLEIQYQGKNIIRTITQTIRNSRSIDFPALSQSSDTLTVVSDGPATSTFSIDNGILVVTENGGPPIPLHNNLVNIESVVFSNLSKPSTPGTVHIEFTLSGATTSIQENYQSDINFWGSASIR